MFFSLFKKKKVYQKKELEISKFLIQKIAYRPKNISFFLTAFTHKSSLNHSEFDLSNERLEYLGDAILDAVIAEMLYLKFPKEDEGYLTQIKSKVVSRKTLSEIAAEMNIRAFLSYDKNRSINLSTLEGNAFEALIGALYLDSGFDEVKKIIHSQIFRKYANLNKILEEEIDFKSKLLIWCQKSRLKLEYITVKEEQFGTNWNYLIEAQINGKIYGSGSGSTKKSAEQLASKETLVLVGEIDA